VEDGFQHKKSTLAAFFDLTRAFDRVWKEGLLFKLLRKGIVVDTSSCSCGQDDQTPYHALQDCPTYREERNQVWPEGMNYQKKLWGMEAEIRSTAQFITHVTSI
jgi:hypothetical protein